MIYTPKIKKAMIIAYNAHNGQVDKSGIPYIYHPIHLAEQMNTETECIVALLHDVVEDTEVTYEDIEREFGKEIADMVVDAAAKVVGSNSADTNAALYDTFLNKAGDK